MTLIDGDRIITAQLYDDEHEEFTEMKMSIIDYINAYTDEGVTTADDVLDKIRAEIIEEKECAYADFDKYKVDYLGVDSRYVEDELPYDDFRYGMERCIEIIDKYRNEVSS